MPRPAPSESSSAPAAAPTLNRIDRATDPNSAVGGNGPASRLTNPVVVVNGYIDVSERPGLGTYLNIEEIKKHPYQQENYLPLFKPGWERRERQAAG